MYICCVIHRTFDSLPFPSSPSPYRTHCTGWHDANKRRQLTCFSKSRSIRFLKFVSFCFQLLGATAQFRPSALHSPSPLPTTTVQSHLQADVMFSKGDSRHAFRNLVQLAIGFNVMQPARPLPEWSSYS